AWHQQVEQGGAPTVLLHLHQLARPPPADLRNDYQPYRQHDQSRRPRCTRSPGPSKVPHWQEGFSQGAPRAEDRAGRLSRRLELRDHAAHGAALIGRLSDSRALRTMSCAALTLPVTAMTGWKLPPFGRITSTSMAVCLTAPLRV